MASAGPRVFAAIVLAAPSVAQATVAARIDAAPGDDAVIAFDANRQRLLAYDSYPAPLFWEWNGQSWRQIDGAGGPTNLGQAAFDAARDAFLMAGGTSVAEWSAGRWTMHTSANWPGGPLQLVFDTQRARLVAWTSYQVVEWSGTSWLHPAQPGAPPRRDAAFAYDPVNGRCVLYGGYPNGIGSTLADCWSWDGTTWTQMAATAPPGPRRSAALEFDRASRRLVLYGGTSGAQTTWALQGSTWTQIVTTTDPGERTSPHFCWDGSGLLLWGGISLDAAFWRLSANGWQRLAEPSPRERSNHRMAYDYARQQVVLFGGRHGPNYTYLDDTWVHDGSWHRLLPATAPSARVPGGLAWSSANNALLLYGGSDGTTRGDTWTWNGTTWTQLAPAITPPPRGGMVLAQDPLGGVLLFGGIDTATWTPLADHWRWNGAYWQQLTPAAVPPARSNAQATYDPLRLRTIVAGGLPGNLRDAWSWDGFAWQALPAPPLVPYDQIYDLAFRPDTGRSLLVTSVGGFEWDGTSWIGGGPVSTNLVSDPRSNRLLAFPIPRPIPESVFASTFTMTPTPASATRYGAGCALGPAPALTTRGRPRPGQPGFSLHGSSGAANAAAFVVLGLTTANQALGGGCTLLVGTTVATIAAPTDALGDCAAALPLPPSTAFRGVAFTAQLAVVDPPHSLLLGVTFSEGLRIQVGD
jgi:hypothetical protein